MAGIASVSSFKKPNSMMSPKSILDTQPFSKNPFDSDPNPTRRTWENRGVCLGIADVLIDESFGTNLTRPESKMVLFGSQLKIQVPTRFSTNSPKSPGDFGIKTRNSQLGSSCSSFSSSPSPQFPVKKLPDPVMSSPGRVLSAIEMELSEDYTCVISHGPNPKTTHIFDDCVIQSCCGIIEFSASKTKDPNEFGGSSFCSDGHLSCCCTCKKNLGHGEDIYMYRGEKAFCSRECRHQKMMVEEEMDTEDVDVTC